MSADTSTKYYTIVTAAGLALEAAAKANGTPINLTQMSVGDANGVEYDPDGSETALVNQKWRGDLNGLTQDANNPNWWIPEAILPDDVGGFTILEIGLHTDSGVLYAIGKYPPSYKPILAQGSGRQVFIRPIFQVSNEVNVTLLTDPAIVMASQAYVNQRFAQLDALLNQAMEALQHRPAAFLIADLPTVNIGAVFVIEACEMWEWVNTPYYQGYRSPDCGRPLDGHTLIPLVKEFDAVGGVLSKTAYVRVWAYAQENGLVVTQAVWMANIGAHYFVDLGGDSFRTPDLRNMFRRYTGTDADTANARALGSYKGDSLKSHLHFFPGESFSGTYAAGDNYTLRYNPATMATDATGSAETAPKHTAYAPRIHA